MRTVYRQIRYFELLYIDATIYKGIGIKYSNKSRPSGLFRDISLGIGRHFLRLAANHIDAYGDGRFTASYEDHRMPR